MEPIFGVEYDENMRRSTNEKRDWNDWNKARESSHPEK
jgi:hypothetical protein